ncbi:MAG: DedA family protein [Acidimicrobiales bacterium]|nr:DedA family protein [Acidimicrobiales bacterium]
MFDFISDLTNELDEISSNWWFILVILIIALLDSVIPVVPSETTVIIGGVAAGQGNQSIVLVIVAGAIGAFLGDNLAYLIGRRFKGRVNGWADKKDSRRERLDGAGRQIRKRGGMLLITARFIPGGRTLLTISSGVTSQPRPWFVGWIAVAVTIWSSYAGILGYIFGNSFKDNHTAAFWLAFVTALAITGLIELVRFVRERRNHAIREVA